MVSIYCGQLHSQLLDECVVRIGRIEARQEVQKMVRVAGGHYLQVPPPLLPARPQILRVTKAPGILLEAGVLLVAGVQMESLG